MEAHTTSPEAMRPLARSGGVRHLALGLLAVVVLLLLFAGGSFVLWDLRRTQAEAEQLALNSSALAASHMNGVLDATSQVLGRVENVVGTDLPEALRFARDRHESLVALRDGLPYLVSLVVTDASGQTMLGANIFPTGPTDVSGRSYFREVQAGAPFHLGPKILGRVAEREIFTVARPLLATAGEFRGALVATIDVARIEEAFAAVDSRGVAVAILDRNGQLIAGGRGAGWPGVDAVQGQTEGLARVDGHILATLPSGRYPFVATAALPEWQALAPWRLRTAIVAVFTLGAVGLAALLFARLWRGLHREQREVRRREAALQDSLEYRNMLIAEVHHRVHNNFQIIGSLLSLQLGASTSEEVRTALADARSRLEMLARLHQVLYQSGEASAVQMDRFVPDLARVLRDAYGVEERGIRILAESDPLSMELGTAVNLGLLISEAVTNAVKHAFPGGGRGTIRVTLRRSGEGFELEIADDGVGLPPTRTEGPGRLGSSLMAHIARGLGATHNVTPGPAGGTRLHVASPGAAPAG